MSSFTIFPAIDLKGGRCVRLLQGRADAETVYGDSPVDMARRWVDMGAEWLHVVDLDGAFAGRPEQTGLVRDIVSAVDVPVQTGGGIRTDEDIRRVLETGVQRVILGTRAWEDQDGLKDLAGIFGDQLVVGIDSRDGRVQIRGWTETTDLTAIDLARKADAYGIRTLILTDTSTDGMLEGTNVSMIREACEAVSCQIIASGGVSSVEDVSRLVGLRKPNLAGAIVGKALYESTVALEDLNRAARA